MDWTSIVVAVIAFLGTFGGSLTGIRTSNKVMELRLEKLEQKVDKHNNLIERMYKVEESTKSAHHRIDELRGR